MRGLCVFALLLLAVLCDATRLHHAPLSAFKPVSQAQTGSAIAEPLDASLFKGDSWKSKVLHAIHAQALATVLTFVSFLLCGRLQQLTFREKLIAGSLARFAAQSSLHPLEVLKARAQSRSGSLQPFTYSVFVKGSAPQIGLSLPAGAVQFSCIELARELIDSSPLLAKHTTPELRNLVAGLMGTFVSMLIKVPQEVLKQGCQTGLYSNSWAALVTILSTRGVGGLYRGFWAQVARDLPWNALSFMLFNLGKRLWEEATGRLSTDRENLLLGAIAGGFAGFISNPIDVVKTRIMTQPLGGEMVYKGIVQTMRKVVEDEGLGVLFRGTVYRVLYLAPLGAIIYATYEAVAKKLLLQRLQRSQQQGVSVQVAPQIY